MMKSQRTGLRRLLPYAFVAPASIFSIVFCGYPLIYSIILSFQNMDMLNFRSQTYGFVGIKQYIDLVTIPRNYFSVAFWNTITFTIVSIVFQFLIGFAIALLLSKRFPGSGLMRSVMMLPWLIPATVAGLLGKYMLSEVGYVNSMFESLGMIDKGIVWLANKDTAMVCVIIFNIWKGTPYNMMLMASGLATIPAEIYESASIDGANGFQRLIRITIPMLFPTILTVLTLGFIGTFKVFDLVFVLTNGGPLHSTELLSSLAYQFSFNSGAFSKGAAVANVMFVILFALSMVYQKLLKVQREARLI